MFSFSIKIKSVRLQSHTQSQGRIQDIPGGEWCQPQKGVRQPIIWPNFAKNCMKMKKNGPERGHTSTILQWRYV